MKNCLIKEYSGRTMESENEQVTSEYQERDENFNVESKDELIKKLKKELKKKEALIELLNQKLSNNQQIIKDIISDKKQLKLQLQEYELSLVDAKLQQYEKLQDEHQKTLHRLQVRKKHLDNANQKITQSQEKIEDLERIIEDLNNRSLWDHLRRKYPESYQRYRD